MHELACATEASARIQRFDDKLQKSVQRHDHGEVATDLAAWENHFRAISSPSCAPQNKMMLEKFDDTTGCRQNI